LDGNHNYPLPLDKFSNNLWTQSTCLDGYRSNIPTRVSNQQHIIGDWVDCALLSATSGQYRSKSAVTDASFDPLLNNAQPSLVGGVLLQFDKVTSDAVYDYASTRNNNFSNRSQKGQLKVTAA